MKNKVIKILNEIRPEFDFNENVNFTCFGMLDSFDIVLLIDILDDEYQISIQGQDIIPENFTSIDNIINLLKKYGVNS
jgi:acyl carrier protein